MLKKRIGQVFKPNNFTWSDKAGKVIYLEVVSLTYLKNCLEFCIRSDFISKDGLARKNWKRIFQNWIDFRESELPIEYRIKQITI